MNKTIWIGLLVAVAVIAGGYWYLHQQTQPPPEAAAPPAPAPAAPAAAPEEQHFPVPEEKSAETAPPLPALDQSDDSFRAVLRGLFGKDSIELLLIPKTVIRNIVITIDSLDRAPAPLRVWPVVPAKGLPLVSGEGDQLILSPDNSARYAPYVTALDAVDVQKLVQIYFRYYPLFQKAYENLGYPGRYFNDRLVQVLDNLLVAPEPQPPIHLVRPKVLYQFADPDLESRSWGQKMLMRMGAANEAEVKGKLREIRAAVSAHSVRAAAGAESPAPATSTNPQ